MVTIKTEKEIAAISEAAQVVAKILDTVKTVIKPGMTGIDLDNISREILKEHKAKPSFLNYHGFPATICVSVNEQLVHGIPNKKPFKEGDLVSVDAGAVIDGFHADAAITVAVGKINSEKQKLLFVTQNALDEAVKIIKNGTRVGDIGFAIQNYVEQFGFHLPVTYTGHGIGRDLHELPAIPNVGKSNTGFTLRTGMTICVEPMVQSSTNLTKIANDGWTVIAQDYLPTAHFEHTILVLENGCKVLSKLKISAK